MTVLSIPNSTLAQVATRRRVQVRPATHLSRMTRYRGGTYSHTVDTIVFSDGTSARTDLIRLNPNLNAYSLDFTGIAPHHPSPYRLGTWAALPHLRTRTCEAEIDWILRHSFPLRTTAQLSQQLRQAGYPLATANISEHEAIAGTQAAIWHLTNGLRLDTRPLNQPTTTRRAPGPQITVEFDDQPQLGGYTLDASADAPTTVTLQKSADGSDWQDISGSHLSIQAGTGRYERTLGIGSTLSTSSHGRTGRGYRYYRLITSTATARITDLGFWLTGTRHYRNPDRVVHLYNYLLSGAAHARHHTHQPDLIATNATADTDLIGPFQLRIPLTLNTTDNHAIVDADGSTFPDAVQPGTDFYLRPAPGTTATTLTATAPHELSGRVLTAVALAAAHQRFTPVALAVPTGVAIEFDITWDIEGRGSLLCRDVVDTRRG